jgi:type I site-specific restriction-modification system R (restriction) subunit
VPVRGTSESGRIVRGRTMKNPTLVVLTDRNDLVDQLFGTFSW